jgi:hypothetical protein
MTTRSRRNASSELRQGLVGALIAGCTAAVASFAGLLDQPPWKLAVASALVAAIGFFLTAAAAQDAQRRSAWLVGVVAMLLLGLVFTYVQLWPAAHVRTLAEYAVDGHDEAGYIAGAGEAGGPPLQLEAPELYEGHTYQFGCKVVLERGVVWLRLADAPYWYPLAGFHAPRGTHPPSLPACQA